MTWEVLSVMTVQAVEMMPEQSVSLLNSSGNFPALIICEHASNYIPKIYCGLGLNESERVSHIAWDPGADVVALELSKLFNAPYIRGEISRLVYDCNRPPEAAGAMPEKSEIFVVPGNQNLSTDERASRVANVYEPFKNCITNLLRERADIKAIITIHSFTPVYNGKTRDVELGILHDDDTRLADELLEVAPECSNMTTRRNSPYGPSDGVTHTLKLHGISNKLYNVMIELRNDLLTTDEACARVAGELYSMLQAALLKLGLAAPNTETAI